MLADLGEASVDELVVRVYDDVAADRHSIAKRSLTAHLLLLKQQGHVEEVDSRWICVAKPF